MRAPLPPLLVLLFVLCPSPFRFARAEPAWGSDKAAHLTVSFGLGAGWYGGLRLLGRDPQGLRLAFSATLAFLPGLLKETYDAGRPGNRFSGVDLAWDAAGAVSGALIALGIDWLIGRLRARRPRNQLVEALQGDENSGALCSSCLMNACLRIPGSRPP